MKKSFFLAAFAAVVLFASCSNEDTTPVVNNQETTLSISLAGVVSPRAIEEPGKVATGTIQLDGSGHIYVLNGAGLVDYQEPIKAAAFTVAGQELERKVLNSNSIYVIANIPSGLISVAATLTDINAVKAFAALVSTQADYTYAALSNVDATPVLISSGTTTPITDGFRVNLRVPVNPTIARLELSAIRTSDDRILSFDVVGVMVDDYYPQFNFGGTFAGTQYKHRSETNLNHYTGTALGQWHSDFNTWSSDNNIAHPGNGDHWAYNVAAGALPRFIIKIDNIVTDAETIDIVGARFLTVSGYTGVTVFEKGKIYVVGGAGLEGGGIEFELEDLHPVPNPEEVEVIVNVDIVEWTLSTPPAILM
jgi:hypothetical protein